MGIKELYIFGVDTSSFSSLRKTKQKKKRNKSSDRFSLLEDDKLKNISIHNERICHFQSLKNTKNFFTGWFRVVFNYHIPQSKMRNSYISPEGSEVSGDPAAAQRFSFLLKDTLKKDGVHNETVDCND